MAPLFTALALLCTLASPAMAARRLPRTTCVPTFFEGVGSVLICAPAPRRHH